MKKSKYIISLMIFFSLISCKRINVDIYDDLVYSPNRKCTNLEGLNYAYVVDTITIDNPIVIRSFNGNLFVMSQLIYDKYYTNSNDFFIYCPDVYLYEDFNIPICQNYNSYTISNRNNFKKQDIKTKKGIIESWIDIRKQKDYLVLLISGFYFNWGFAPEKPYSIEFGKNKFNYYKLAIPIEKGKPNKNESQIIKIPPLPPNSLLAE